MKTVDLIKRSLAGVVALGAAAVLALGVSAPVVSAFAEDAPATDQATVLNENQKTATELDENLETKVTLSFPGKREAEPADVVFCP